MKSTSTLWEKRSSIDLVSFQSANNDSCNYEISVAIILILTNLTNIHRLVIILIPTADLGQAEKPG